MSETTAQDGKREGNVFEQTAAWLTKVQKSGLLGASYQKELDRALKGLDRLNEKYGDDVSAIWHSESFNQADRSTFRAARIIAFVASSEAPSLRLELSPIIAQYLMGASHRS